MSDVGSARRVKEQLKTDFGNEPWCVGVGVEREDGVGFVVRVSVRPGQTEVAKSRIPERVNDVFVKIVENDA